MEINWTETQKWNNLNYVNLAVTGRFRMIKTLHWHLSWQRGYNIINTQWVIGQVPMLYNQLSLQQLTIMQYVYYYYHLKEKLQIATWTFPYTFGWKTSCVDDYLTDLWTWSSTLTLILWLLTSSLSIHDNCLKWMKEINLNNRKTFAFTEPLARHKPHKQSCTKRI